ncbi:MAG: pilus assembly protein FimV, partial [Pseudomonadota bacterium]|nr:pilus assembly protein FimV [Pseudomonadota bacterium]
APIVKPIEAPAVAAAPAPAPVKAPVAAPKVKPPVAAAPETSWVDDLLGNALLLPGLGLALVGLGAFGIYSSRRKKKSQQFEDSILTDSNLKANSLFGSTGGQSVDTNNSVFNSNFAPSASQLDANEVDPVAEADVYIAYGRDAQAEEILKEALRTQPERNAVRLKLLEIYSHRKDSRAFELMASELYALTKGQGDDWAQAASMGLALDPSNPMYAGAKPVVPAPLHATDSAPAHTSGDDLDLEALLASTQANTLAGAMNTISPEVTHHMDEQKLDANTASYFDAGPSEAAKPAAGTGQHHGHSTDEHGLDFDLEGLGVQDVESKEVLIDPAKLTADDHHAHDLTFNLDPSHKSAAHDVEAVDFTEAHAVAPLPVTAAMPPADSAMHDGAMEFHLPPLDEVTAAHPAADTHVAPAEALHLPTEHAVQPHVEAAAPVPAPAHPAPMDFDLSGISLDLDPDASHASVAPATAAAAPTVHHHDLAHESADTLVLEDDEISTTPEMATKLDLAIAYEEIGDKEGARELLDEVVKGGSSEQVAQAKAMLVKLG